MLALQLEDVTGTEKDKNNMTKQNCIDTLVK